MFKDRREICEEELLKGVLLGLGVPLIGVFPPGLFRDVSRATDTLDVDRVGVLGGGGSDFLSSGVLMLFVLLGVCENRFELSLDSLDSLALSSLESPVVFVGVPF